MPHGKVGLVPAPAAGAQAKFLRGDATWQTIASVDTQAYITETWNSGTSWYRKWSDGWIEQEGRTNQKGDITFLIPFTQVPYAHASAISKSTANHDVFIGTRTISTTGATFRGGGWATNGTIVDSAGIVDATWYACGY